MSVWTIVVAAGSGERFGSDKLMVKLGGVTVLERSLATARACSDGVVLVWRDEPWSGSEVDFVVPGGKFRSDSVRAGLAVVPEDATIVIVHDAARPLASEGVYANVIAAVQAGADAAVPGIPVVDTVKRVEGTHVKETIPRDALRAIQTPQAFRPGVLRAAHAQHADSTDDAALVEANGGTVLCVPGELHNQKLTNMEDVARMEMWCV